MRKLIFGVLFILASHVANCQGATVIKHHNKIDDISSSADIARIFNPMKGEDSIYYTINNSLNFKEADFTKLQLVLKAPAWVKADFDNNGYTDIMFTGNDNTRDPFVFCLLDSGENKFFIKRITRRSFQRTVLPVAKSINGIQSILYYHYLDTSIYFYDTNYIKLDTLVYKFGDFIEYNKIPANYNIKKIEYKTDGFWGKFSEYTIIINKNREAIYKATGYNENGEPLHGSFRTAVDNKRYEQIVDLLNYINFPTLANEYNVTWSDDQTCYLTITYDNGTTKKIEDYGLVGSFGLNDLYNMLTDLRLNQNWK